MDENGDIQLAKKRLLVDTIEGQKEICAEKISCCSLICRDREKQRESQLRVSAVSLTQEPINILLINFYRQFQFQFLFLKPSLLLGEKVHLIIRYQGASNICYVWVLRFFFRISEWKSRLRVARHLSAGCTSRFAWDEWKCEGNS